MGKWVRSKENGPSLDLKLVATIVVVATCTKGTSLLDTGRDKPNAGQVAYPQTVT